MGAVLSCFGIVGAAAGVFLILLILRLFSYGSGLEPILSREPLSKRIVWTSLLAGVILAAVLPFVTLSWRHLLDILEVHAPNQMIAENIVSSSGWNLVLMLVSSILVAPVMEELLFRRLVYGLLLDKCGPLPALVVSSMVFSAIHGSLTAAPALVVVGALLVVWYRRKGNILAPMLMHASYNAVTVVMLELVPVLED
ncbi:MAG: CPBP family intramembrane metalloprotease [Victivallaceae bacterium]|nr:CPBP family intramembrane metalloprotease [Victivallaceae bacterium]